MRLADGGDVQDGSTPGASDYVLISASRTFRVNADQSTTPVVILTALSKQYGVQYTWTITAKTWDASGAPGAAGLKTSQVNAICNHDYVQDFRTEQDQGPSGVLYNYAIVTVGADGSNVTGEARIRMDQLGEPGAFAAISNAWALVQAAGG